MYKIGCHYVGHFSIIACKQYFLRTLDRFIAAYREGHASQAFENLQFDRHQDGFLFLLPAYISADLYIVAKCDDALNDCFDPFLIILAFCSNSEIYRGSYVGMEHPLLCCDHAD